MDIRISEMEKRMGKQNKTRTVILKKISASAACAVAFILLTACGAQEMEKSAGAIGIALTEMEAASVEKMIPKVAGAESAQKDISIDFPFPDRMNDGYTLSLVCVDEAEETYELHFNDKDKKIVQQLPCGKLAGHISFCYDDLTSDGYGDLEIFSSGSQNMLLFASNAAVIETGKLFLDEAVEIPIIDAYNRILIAEEDGMYRTETVYEINKEKNSLEARASLKLQKEDAILELWDYLENRSIFEGKAALQEDGSLVNEEYFQYLCWGDLHYLWRESEDSTIRVWVSEAEKEDREQSGFEWAQGEVFGNTGHTEEYENRETFLTDFGFADKESFYQYYDNRGNLQLELYLDEESGKGCGLIYEYIYTYQLERKITAYGFAFDAVYQGKWEAADPYLLTSVEGYTGENEGREYEEIIEYTEDGKIDYYKSMAFVDWIGGEEEKEEKDILLNINYIYRDDGTLYFRDYSHNSMVFSTSFCSLDSYYDELGRVVYKSSYITHGSYEEYYIYDDGGEEPAYYLSLDDNLGYCIPTLVRFH